MVLRCLQPEILKNLQNVAVWSYHLQSSTRGNRIPSCFTHHSPLAWISSLRNDLSVQHLFKNNFGISGILVYAAKDPRTPLSTPGLYRIPYKKEYQHSHFRTQKKLSVRTHGKVISGGTYFETGQSHCSVQR